MIFVLDGPNRELQVFQHNFQGAIPGAVSSRARCPRRSERPCEFMPCSNVTVCLLGLSDGQPVEAAKGSWSQTSLCQVFVCSRQCNAASGQAWLTQPRQWGDCGSDPHVQFPGVCYAVGASAAPFWPLEWQLQGTGCHSVPKERRCLMLQKLAHQDVKKNAKCRFKIAGIISSKQKLCCCYLP